MFLMAIQEPEISINSPPLVVEMTSFFFINIIVMIGFFNIAANFLFYNFASLIIKHSFLCDTIHPLIIFICLLFLGNCISTFMFSHIVFKVVFSVHFTV